MSYESAIAEEVVDIQLKLDRVSKQLDKNIHEMREWTKRARELSAEIKNDSYNEAAKSERRALVALYKKMTMGLQRINEMASSFLQNMIPEDDMVSYLECFSKLQEFEAMREFSATFFESYEKIK